MYVEITIGQPLVNRKRAVKCCECEKESVCNLLISKHTLPLCSEHAAELHKRTDCMKNIAKEQI